MRTAKDLSREQLESIVQNIQDILFLDRDEKGEFWNEDKQAQVSGADFVGSVLDSLDLTEATPKGNERTQSAFETYSLFAAAPDLLAALKECVARFGDMALSESRTPEIVDRAVAAIAKAEGRTP